MTLPSSTQLPLVVDLDGTLIKTDLLAETASRFLIGQPFRFLKLLVWLTQGKSALKSHLAESTRIDAAALPYNEALLSWLRQEKTQGRTLVLATASHRACCIFGRQKGQVEFASQLKPRGHMGVHALTHGRARSYCAHIQRAGEEVITPKFSFSLEVVLALHQQAQVRLQDIAVGDTTDTYREFLVNARVDS